MHCKGDWRKKHLIDGGIPEDGFAGMHLPVLSYENGHFLLVLYCKHNSSTGCCLRTSTSSSTAHRQNSQAIAQFDSPIQLAADSSSFTSVSKIAHAIPLKPRMTALSNVSDPWDMRVHGTPMTIEFYGYRAPVNKLDAQRCLEKAASEAADRILWADWTLPMEPLPHSYSYTDDRVNLWLRIEPGEILLWLYWFGVLGCFPQYFEANEWRGTQFVILWDEPSESKVVAFGHLVAE